MPKTKQRVIVLRGLPASGKSTWARSFIAEQAGRGPAFKRINKDDLRAMIDDSAWSKEREKFILAARDALIFEALKEGHSVIVDDTNFPQKHFEQIQKIAWQFGIDAEIRVFDTDVEECLRRDAARSKPVGRDVIMRMYRQFVEGQPPVAVTVESTAEAAIVASPSSTPPVVPTSMTPPPPTTPPPYDPTKPDCIIVDVDGTVALHSSGRSPFDWHRVGEDEPNATVIRIIGDFLTANQGLELVFVSGRDAVCYPQTSEWLRQHVRERFTLLMRPAGDNRKDSVVKREIYEQAIRDRWNVIAVFDDRRVVVDMWRDLGLVCLQVANGDF